MRPALIGNNAAAVLETALPKQRVHKPKRVRKPRWPCGMALAVLIAAAALLPSRGNALTGLDGAFSITALAGISRAASQEHPLETAVDHPIVRHRELMTKSRRQSRFEVDENHLSNRGQI